MKSHRYIKVILTYISTTGLLFGIAVFLGFQYYKTSKSLQSVKSELASSEEKLQDTTAEKASISDALTAAQNNIANLETRVTELGGAVGRYEKLGSLDPQLLQKYSKIYFLNENYKPTKLVDIDPIYTFDKKRVYKLHASVYTHFKNMMSSSNNLGLNLLVGSSYRSFEEQSKLKSAYTVMYGTTKANSFSADQGYSEHQLGTTIDFTTGKTGDISLKFENTPEFKWLTDNAYLYGFIMSYPKDNKYYIYEPWHWRFVGRDLATKLHNENKHLYELDQREIDGYLLSIFD